jgi:hypothetical protein
VVPPKKEGPSMRRAYGKCRMGPQSILWRTPPKGGAYAASVSLLTAFRKAGYGEEGGLLPLISSSQDATSTQRMPLSAVTSQSAVEKI